MLGKIVGYAGTMDISFMSKTFRLHRNTWLISALTILIVVVMLWLPFGLKRSDPQVGWTMLYLVREREWSLNSGRIMAALSWWGAGLMTPNSFVGLQLIMIFFFWAKAFIVYLILRFLRVMDAAQALLIAILFMVYPADRGLFTTQALGYHSGVFFYLLSVLFLVLSCKYSNRLYLLPMAIAHVVACFTSEAGSILTFFTPLLLLLIPGCPQKRKISILVIWYLILFSSLINYSLYWIADDSYQSMRFEGGLSEGPAAFVLDVIVGNLKAIGYAFVISWWDTIENLLTSNRYLPYAIIITLVTVGGIWWLKRGSGDDGNTILDKRKTVYGLIAGAFIFMAGFFPFSVTDLRYANFRVYYYSALGAALFWGIILNVLDRNLLRRNPNILLVINAVLILGIAVRALDQHASFYNVALKQQHILASIMGQAPYVKTNTIVVLMEKKATARVFPNEHIFSVALKWAYSNKDINGRICYQGSADCRFVENGLDYHSSAPNFAYMDKTYPYENLLVFQVMDDGSADLLYDISSLFSSASTYKPYDRIASYFPFPELPQKAFYGSVGPNPQYLSPKYWRGINLTFYDRKVCDISGDKQCSLHLQGDQFATASFHQEIITGGSAGQTVTISFLIKAERSGDDASWPQTTLNLVNTDDTTTIFRQTLNKLTEDWQYTEWKVEAAKPYKSIIVSFESGYGSWSIWIDSIKIFVDNQLLPLSNSSFED